MLTVKQIEKLKPQDKSYKVSDQHGLCLQITPNGSKLWRWRYRFEGAANEMSLGEYPFVSLEQARELHNDGRKLLKNGVDPMGIRKGQKTEQKQAVAEKQSEKTNSFEQVARRWFAKHSVGKNQKYMNNLIHRLETYVFPAFGFRYIKEVTTTEIRECILGVEAKGHRDLAGRLLNNISAIFRYAAQFDLVTHDPASSLKAHEIMAAPQKENRPRVSEKELPQLLAAIDEYQGIAGRLALKLLAYTMARPGMIQDARWEDFHLDKAQWILPKERMKPHGNNSEGQPKQWPHIVPLATQVIKLLDVIAATTGNDMMLFPNENDPKRGMSDNTLAKALKDMGYKGRQSPHGFKGIASTVLYENDFQGEHIELQLAHIQGDEVAAAYNYARYIPQRTEMMQWYADYLDRKLEEGRSARKTA